MIAIESRVVAEIDHGRSAVRFAATGHEGLQLADMSDYDLVIRVVADRERPGLAVTHCSKTRSGTCVRLGKACRPRGQRSGT